MNTIDVTRREVVGSPSETVVEAVAEFKDVDPVDLSPALYDAVDPDALDALFGADGFADGRVEFVYAGCEVEIDSAGQVVVSDPR